MRLRPWLDLLFDRAARSGAVALLGGTILLAALCLAGPSLGGDACDQACANARLAKSFADDPAAAARHTEAMTAYLKKAHGGAVPQGAIAAPAIAPPLHPTTGDGDLAATVRDYLKAPYQPAAVAPAPVRVAQLATSPAPPAQPAESRNYVGEEVCSGCHQAAATNWAHTIHAKVFTLNPQNALEKNGCEACHGPGSAHIKNPRDPSTIIRFSSTSVTPVAQQNGQCLACHSGGQRIFWHASIHEANNVACSDCHNPMANFSVRGLTARQSINETCFACHKEQHAQFSRRSHMPLLEGKLDCTDCHNPHGSATAPLLKADSVNEVCYGCHAEKRGPFIFEHAPVRENCLNCHNPHGSNFEALLTAPRPLLCQQCHAQTGHPAELMTAGNMANGPLPDPRLIGASCQSCHSEVHGSNSPAGARLER